MESTLHQGITYLVEGKRVSYETIVKALQAQEKEQQRNRKKAIQYYHKKRADLPGKDAPVEASSDLPGKDAPVEASSDLPGKDAPVESDPLRTDHRGRIFHTKDENGRLLTYNGRPWVPIPIPKFS